MSLLFLLVPNALAQAAGDKCNEDDPAPRDGLVCLPAFIGIDGVTVPEWDYDPPYIANAQKGDVVLSAGCGMIGNLLRKSDPPMKYSHTGIMVEDQYLLRHSTAAEDRYADYGIGFSAGSDGLRADVLRYGWPGTITETIDEAYLGSFHEDPESGKSYFMTGFNPRAIHIKPNELGCRDHGDLVPPLVLRPPPETEAYGSEVAADTDNESGPTNIRLALHDGADAALEIDGHYRFFGYTVGVVDEPAPASSGWAEGTIGTVCTSFIRFALSSVGFTIEDELEPSDIAAGAELPADPTDGQYLYSEEERLAAGQYLYDQFWDIAYEEAGWFGNWLTDAAGDNASQITNCFMHDWCGEEDPPEACAGEIDEVNGAVVWRAQDSSCWETPGLGDAVAPDNLLWWDGPDKGGPYGYSEEMDFQDGTFVRVHRWQAASGYGDVYGTVYFEDAPVEGAVVTVQGIAVSSDENGNYELIGVPAGDNVPVQGCLSGTNGDYQAVDVPADGRVELNLVLDTSCDYHDPGITAWNREVVVKGSIFLRDDEWWPWDDEIANVSKEAITLLAPPTASDDDSHLGTVYFEECVGDEVRAEITFSTKLNVEDRSVDVMVAGRMFEGTSCNTDDEEATVDFMFTVTEDGVYANDLWMQTGEWNSDDRVEMEFTVENLQQ